MKKAMALLLACSMVLAFAACSKKQHTEQEVTAVVDVTDENGKTVTDKDGKAQTRVVTIPQTDAKGNTVAAGESAADGKSAGNGGSAAKDGKTGKDKTEKATKKKETTTKKTTTTTTTVAANRKIHISVSLPAGTDTRTDKLRITINGKQVDEKKVTLEIGNTFTYTTEKKYRGDVKVQVELEHTQKRAKVTVKKGTDTAKFNFENIENLLGDDD
ncbi:MAG: hypothetical protein EGQ06_03655 [Ruminococcaceae bacterium]|jgi:hypothetical protein|nr:hypothetical protein [Oscillospiraceae bacterium]